MHWHFKKQVLHNVVENKHSSANSKLTRLPRQQERAKYMMYHARRKFALYASDNRRKEFTSTSAINKLCAWPILDGRCGLKIYWMPHTAIPEQLWKQAASKRHENNMHTYCMVRKKIWGPLNSVCGSVQIPQNLPIISKIIRMFGLAAVHIQMPMQCLPKESDDSSAGLHSQHSPKQS